MTKKHKKERAESIIPGQYHSLFWDTDIRKIDIYKNAKYIIERVLEMGDLNAFYWIQMIYPTNIIIETLGNSRRISPRSKNFWRIWLRDYVSSM